MRQTEYEAAADVAHDRRLIGRTLAPEVDYDVGPGRIAKKRLARLGRRLLRLD